MPSGAAVGGVFCPSSDRPFGGLPGRPLTSDPDTCKMGRNIRGHLKSRTLLSEAPAYNDLETVSDSGGRSCGSPSCL